jgi:hypothetical protein
MQMLFSQVASPGHVPQSTEPPQLSPIEPQ